jgi:DNA sulfur modification protein DndD
MKFNTLTIENFRQFRDKQKIEFAKDHNKNITVICGRNGHGKTRLLLSLNWLLHNDELEERGTKTRAGNKSKYIQQNVVNDDEIEEAAIGEEMTTRIELKINDNSNTPLYEITRTQTHEKISDTGETKETSNANATFGEFHGKGFGTLEDIQVQPKLETIIPPEISQFLFFDGELLRKKFDSFESLKQIIEDASRITTLRHTIKHMEATKTQLTAGVDPSGALKDLLEQKEKDTASKGKMQAEFDRCKREEKEAEEEIENLNRQLRQFGGEEASNTIQGKLDEIATIEENLLTLNEDIDNYNIDRATEIMDKSFPIFIQDSVSDLLKKITLLRDEKRIPPVVDKNTLLKIIEKRKCLCGTTFQTGGSEHKHLLELVKQNADSKTGEILTLFGAQLDQSISKSKELESKLKRIDEGEKQTLAKIKLKDKEIKDLQKLIEEVDKEKLEDLMTQLGEQKLQLKAALKNQGMFDTLQKKAEIQLGKIETAIQETLSKESKYKEISAKREKFDETIKFLQSVLDEIVSDIRSTVQEKTQTHFDKLNSTEKDKYNAKFIIDEHFTPHLIKQKQKSEKDVLPGLNAGHKQILALAFTAALSSVSNFDVPIFIDTPLGRLDIDNRQRISRYFPQYLDQKQLVLLMTPSELTRDVYKTLFHRIGKIYRINPTTKDISEIKPVPREHWSGFIDEIQELAKEDEE